MKRLLILLIIILSVYPSLAQDNEKYLKEYIETGLRNNLDIQSARANLNSYGSKVNQAFSAYLPKVDFTTRYTRAGGGRTLPFPMGDMIEGALQAKLPDDIKLKPASLAFLNVNASFIRPYEQDTKFEIVQPVFNWAIINSNKAAKSQQNAAMYEYKAKEINLAYSIKEAYYNFVKSLQLVDIRRGALDLAQENNKVVNKLFAVDKAPKVDILRSEVLLSSTKQDVQNSENTAKMAKNFFNTIMNEGFQNEVKYQPVTLNDLMAQEHKVVLNINMSIDEAAFTALNSRPEIRQLELSMEALKHSKNIISGDYMPSLTVVADYGVQGEKYEFGPDARYWMVSGVLSWNLFSGFGTNAKEQEIEYQIESLEKSLESVKQMIKLEVQNNYIDYQNNMDQLAVAEKTYLSAEENHRITKISYEEGIVPLINLVDAQTTLTGAKANYVVTYYNILNAKAKLEKSVGISVRQLAEE